MIKAVTIDLWGTLLLDSPATDERYRRERLAHIAETLSERGIEVPIAALARGYEESRRQLVRIWREMRDVPVERYATLLLQAVDAALPGRLDVVGARLANMLVIQIGGCGQVGGCWQVGGGRASDSVPDASIRGLSELPTAVDQLEAA